jgi:hypothetical protein
MGPYVIHVRRLNLPRRELTKNLWKAIAAVAVCMGTVGSSFAETDIKCDGTSDRKSDAIICDYAILRSSYQSIFDRQTLLTNKGLLAQGVLDSWRQERDNCDSVSCMDGVFARWNAIDASIVVPPTPQEEAASSAEAQPVIASAPELAASAVSAPSQSESTMPRRDAPAARTSQLEASAQPALPEPGVAGTPDGSQSTPPKKDDSFLWLLFCLVGAGMAASGPKPDRRFKTGYKGNQVPNWKLKGLGVLVVLVGLAVKFF